MLEASLAEVDSEIADLIVRDGERQADTIDLIASESTAPAAVLEALGSVLSNKTGEGYPGHRYHRGTAWVDAVEMLAIERAKTLFGAEHANVQAHSGVNANLGVYQAVLKPGDPVLAMGLAHGGHLSHGDPASITGRVYRFAHYGVRQRSGLVALGQFTFARDGESLFADREGHRVRVHSGDRAVEFFPGGLFLFRRRGGRVFRA